MNNENWIRAAMIWISNMANPNEGMTNPLDDDKLKSIANLLASLNVELDEVVIYNEGHKLNIQDKPIRKIIDTFKKASKKKFKTYGKFPEDFLKSRLEGIV